MHGKLSGSRYERKFKVGSGAGQERRKRGNRYGLPGNLCGCLFPGQTDDGKPGEARELVRQVYLVVFRTISTLQDTTKMERWLYTVLYKLGERECRKKGIILEDEKTAPSWEGQEAPETPAERQQIVRILKSSYKQIGTADGLSVWRITTRDGAWKSFPPMEMPVRKAAGNPGVREN